MTRDTESAVRRLGCMAVLMLGIQAAVALAAADFTIEDKGLAALPQDVEIAIRARTGTEFKSCRLIGKPIDLSGKSGQSAYAATTADACGWNASIGPVWVILAQCSTLNAVCWPSWAKVLMNSDPNVRGILGYEEVAPGASASAAIPRSWSLPASDRQYAAASSPSSGPTTVRAVNSRSSGRWSAGAGERLQPRSSSRTTRLPSASTASS